MRKTSSPPARPALRVKTVATHGAFLTNARVLRTSRLSEGITIEFTGKLPDARRPEAGLLTLNVIRFWIPPVSKAG
jgi:hypothetical protein